MSSEQNWKGIDGATAWHLIDRHGEGWEGIAQMMESWRAANQSDLQAIVRSSILAYKEARNGESYHPGHTEHERMAWEIGRAEVEREMISKETLDRIDRINQSCTDFERKTAALRVKLPEAIDISYQLTMDGVPLIDDRRVFYADKEWCDEVKKHGFDSIVGLRIIPTE